MSLPPPSLVQSSVSVAPAPTLELRASTYDDRRLVLPSLLEALLGCGCWLQERKAVTLTQTDFCLELPLRSVVDFYGALIAAGLELARGSHQHLTAFCLVRQHRHIGPPEVGRVIAVRLQVSFLDEMDAPAHSAPTAAAA